jgi:chemotaxis protein MotD
MTMPDLASAHVVTGQADGASSRGRAAGLRSSAEERADADFRAHLASVAADEDTTTRSEEDRASPGARWRHRSETETILLLGRDQGKDPGAVAFAGAVLNDGPAIALALPDTAATALPRDAVLVLAKADAAAPLPPPAGEADALSAEATATIGHGRFDRLGGGDAGATGALQDVFVVHRQTHFAPIAPLTSRHAASPGVTELPASDASALADGTETPGADAKPMGPHPAVTATGGKDGEQWPAPGSPSRSPVAEAGPQVQAATTDDAFEAPQVGRGAGLMGDEALPPAQLPSSPVRQIADRIAADIAPVGDKVPIDSASSAMKAAATHPLKVLTIQLQPVELGTITVRIALRNDALELQIEAGRRDTARLLDADRETLAGLLRSAGYSVEAMTVRAVEPPGAAASSGLSQGHPDAGPQSQSGGSQPDAKPFGGRAHAEPDSTFTRRDSNDEEDRARHRAGDSLYV